MIFANTSHAQAVILKNYRSQLNECKFLHADIFLTDCVQDFMLRIYVVYMVCVF